MKFDRFDEKDFEPSVLPDGNHEVEIKSVKTVIMKDGSGDRCVVKFQDINDAHDPVEKWLNPNEKRDQRAAMDLLSALSLPWDYDIDDSIEGRRLVIVTKRAVKDGEPVLDRDGNQRVYVNGFLPSLTQPSGSQPVAKAAAKRTPTQKADAAAAMPNDDIPF